MRIVIFGGTGQLGGILKQWLSAKGHEIQVVGRSVDAPALRWDGRTDGPWMKLVDGADAVINLTGRSVNCRYNWANLKEMMQSRIDSCEAVGRAIAQAEKPPPVWIQASTATVYAHNTGPAHDEEHGIIGGHETDVPDYWAYSVAIARSWELALQAAPTPNTRKVAIRTGFTMSPDKNGVFDWMVWLAKHGLGGPFVGGEQYISWITGEDLARAILFCIENETMGGPVNLTAPEPIRQRDFMAELCEQVQAPFAVPIAHWMAQIGAVFLKTDIELMLKSRRVVPGKLLKAGFEFKHPTWRTACPALIEGWKMSYATAPYPPELSEAALHEARSVRYPPAIARSKLPTISRKVKSVSA